MLRTDRNVKIWVVRISLPKGSPPHIFRPDDELRVAAEINVSIFLTLGNAIVIMINVQRISSTNEANTVQARINFISAVTIQSP